MKKMARRYLAGIDEAGRGPLAGPVAVGAVLVDSELYGRILAAAKRGGIRDSKKLSEKKREYWHGKVLEWEAQGLVRTAVVLVGAGAIDRRGIAAAIREGIDSCLNRLGASPEETEVRLDGGIKAPDRYDAQTTIIKGDDKEPVISLASVMAKVTRDAYMTKLHARMPEYEFYLHKGYGTKKHYAAIARFGLSKEHRRSFLKSVEIE